MDERAAFTDAIRANPADATARLVFADWLDEQSESIRAARLTLVDFAVVPGECRLSHVAPGEVVMLEACGIIPTTPEVERFLRALAGE